MKPMTTLRDVGPTTKQQTSATALTKNAARREKFQKIGAAIGSHHHIWDKDYGAVMPHNWGVRKSQGFDVLQIITEKRPSKLEQRSEETPEEKG